MRNYFGEASGKMLVNNQKYNFIFFKKKLWIPNTFFLGCTCNLFSISAFIHSISHIPLPGLLVRIAQKYYLHYLHVLLTLPVHNAVVKDRTEGLGSGRLSQSLTPFTGGAGGWAASWGLAGGVRLSPSVSPIRLLPLLLSVLLFWAPPDVPPQTSHPHRHPRPGDCCSPRQA